MEFHKAKKIADRIVELLSPSCERVDIAGSIRREKLEVKDVEILCIPKRVSIPTTLFGDTEERIDPRFSETLDAITHERIKGQTDGKYIQLILKKARVSDIDLKMDLFIPDPDDYYRQLAIRTGSSEYSHRVIAGGWNRLGWVGSDLGLRKQSDCVKTYDKNQKHSGWKCVHLHGDKPPAWQSEAEFFEWLRVPILHPKDRNL